MSLLTFCCRRVWYGGCVLLCWLGSGGVWAQDLAWLEQGRATPLAVQATALLQDAASQGLVPQAYGATPLAQRVSVAREHGVSATEAVALDTALNQAMLQYLQDLHQGRVDPHTLHHNYRLVHVTPFDVEAVLKQALLRQDMGWAVAAAVPHVPQYEHLRKALAQYRAWVGHAAWQTPLPPWPLLAPAQRAASAKLEPGQAYPGLRVLAQRLQLVGDMPAGAALPDRYDGVVVDAVRQFQRRHGLADDGVLGRATLAQLNVPPDARVRQIELALERLRWTPFLQSRRMVVVNLPEFVLRAYEVQDTGRVQLRQEMKVVVGKAMDTRTPLFDEDMRFIEFSPYWNVPPSIARKELVPKLRRDPAHWVQQGFEFVGPGGQVATGLSAAHLDGVLAGQWRIRQRPGPHNALGDIKFVFPNRDNIYLHHTPATALFERERRDFSHGCIRVEHPLALAQFVLAEMPEWTEERIREAMDKGQSRTLRLSEPLPVLITYGTTLVKGGLTYFYDDIYGLDRVLDAALRRLQPAPERSRKE